MCLLEGYSNSVMDHIGAQLMADYGLIKARFEARRSHQTRVDKIWNKITGLEMKLEQYVLGEIFVNAVVAERGIGFMNRVFASPQTLPDMAEIRQPGGGSGGWSRRQPRPEPPKISSERCAPFAPTPSPHRTPRWRGVHFRR